MTVPASALAAAATPGLWRRMACFIYEGMIVFGIGLIPGAIGALFVAEGKTGALQSDGSLRLIAYAIYAIYFTWFWSRRGQTLPMQTWHIRVVTETGGPLSQTKALGRYLACGLWFAPAVIVASVNHWRGWDALAALVIGMVAYALLALAHPQRQFWHDALCGTRLVHAPPEAVGKRKGRTAEVA
jgi:uncharacterized RDD family membrane protein YckC